MARNHESGTITIYGLMHNAYPEPTYISTCQFKKIFSTQIHICLLCWYQLIRPKGNLTLRISDIWYTCHVKPIQEKTCSRQIRIFLFVGTSSSNLKDTWPEDFPTYGIPVMLSQFKKNLLHTNTYIFALLVPAHPT